MICARVLTCLYMFIHQLFVGSLNDDFASSVFHVSFTSVEIPLKYNRSAQES